MTLSSLLTLDKVDASITLFSLNRRLRVQSYEEELKRQKNNTKNLHGVFSPSSWCLLTLTKDYGTPTLRPCYDIPTTAERPKTYRGLTETFCQPSFRFRFTRDFSHHPSTMGTGERLAQDKSWTKKRKKHLHFCKVCFHQHPGVHRECLPTDGYRP